MIDRLAQSVGRRDAARYKGSIANNRGKFSMGNSKAMLSYIFSRCSTDAIASAPRGNVYWIRDIEPPLGGILEFLFP